MTVTDAPKDDISQYELKRLEQIKENQRLLQELGLSKAKRNDIPIMPDIAPPTKKARYRSAPKPVVTASRVSRRLRGETPDDTVDLESIVSDNDKVRQVVIDQTSQKDAMAKLHDQIYVPLTIASIGTTIWSLGELWTGKGRSKYWSGRGCRYKHPYPIGYRATKSHFGNQYIMDIKKGKPGEGPIFTVQIDGKDTVFEGNTPTAPWTEACKRSKSQNTRVSGPLFFGFSDLITMRLIENMEGYELACQPEGSSDENESAP